jgi:quinol monooxygenase YgiN
MLRLLAFAALANTIFAVTMLTPNTAVAEDASFFTVTYVEVGPLLAKVGAATMQSYREAGRKDKGNVHLDVFESLDRPNQTVALAAWADRAAYESHITSAHYMAFKEKLQTMLLAPIDTRVNTVLSGSVVIAPGKSAKDAIVAITHVDVVPPQKDNAVAALKQLADSSRQHPGNLQFHVWQQIDRPNHFTIVEAWASRGAFNVHQMRGETREFRTKLAPMAGALYDERLYKPLK